MYDIDVASPSSIDVGSKKLHMIFEESKKILKKSLNLICIKTDFFENDRDVNKLTKYT